ncbi:MAG: hypothetical protein CL535_06930 [Ahrensia sp.]|nr:hypothetical protein [Ahrensia sp.]|tara:strand:+ start:25859 stop:27250 length:1392 start_codon:yes stop_codon:yes gene_type:complete
MADFEAVLRKTLSGMVDPSADARTKVYDRARATIERQIAAMPKRPPDSVIQRQYEKLDAAIAIIEEEYTEPDYDEPEDFPAADQEDPLASFLAEQETGGGPFSSSPRRGEERDEGIRAERDTSRRAPEMAPPPARSGRHPVFWVAIGLAVLIFAGAIGYAGISIFGSPGGTQVTGDDGLPMREVPSTRVTVDDTDRSGTETVTANADEGASDGPPKFTQRLTPDGREVDDGPANAPGSGGEGTSVAGQSPGDGTAPPDAGSNGSDTGAAQDNDQRASLPVGQRAIFYQERTGAQAGTAEAGSTIWTVVQESPGGDAPLEPAIRAEANIPELGLTMEMTIRRNLDQTFPASHVIELFFRVPDTFDGRGIADVQRITFKGTEQDPGNALIGVAAPLDTNIFLIALTDADTAIETNLNLMQRQDWIDIPMQYISGRRALITLEKGVPGEQVFNEVLAAWEKAGQAG